MGQLLLLAVDISYLTGLVISIVAARLTGVHAFSQAQLIKPLYGQLVCALMSFFSSRYFLAIPIHLLTQLPASNELKMNVGPPFTMISFTGSGTVALLKKVLRDAAHEPSQAGEK